MSTWGAGKLARALALASALALTLTPSGIRAPQADPGSVRSSERQALALALREDGTRGIVSFYATRNLKPLWFAGDEPRPEVQSFLALLATASREGLEPDDYAPGRLAAKVARADSPEERASAELALSRALAAYVADLRTPPAPARMTSTDLELPPQPPSAPLAVLQAAARAPSLRDHLRQLEEMNPVYESLREALAAHRAGRPAGAAPDTMERLILANMARVRGIPRDPGHRFLLVDAAGAELKVYEHGAVVDSMPVIVGRPDAPTPIMAGMVRYVRFNPYWNVPEDMVRDGIAPRVLREGTGFLKARRMQALSDWSASARPLDLDQVDWNAVASGKTPLRLRQLPGGDNMMGAVKLMLPNVLGIYLHDTPNKGAFVRSPRTLSSGCVRLADAGRLTRRLLGWKADRPFPKGPNQRVDLPAAAPVYITYLTVELTPTGVARRTDIYGRDPTLLAALETPKQASADA